MKLLTQKCTTRTLATLMCCIGLFFFIHLWIVNYIVEFANDVTYTARRRFFMKSPQNGTKYILSWSKYHLLFNKGKSIFPRLNCSVKNCEFTEDRFLLGGNYNLFDAIIFHNPDLVSKVKPKTRWKSQLYIFTSEESSFRYPACEVFNDNFFNWTFTVRLDSTVSWRYFVVRNSSGAIIAPSMQPNWQSNSRAIRPEIKAVINGKKKAGAWLVSHCAADSQRDEYLTTLQDHLFAFSLNIDIYGRCTQRRCPNNDCEIMLKKDYYFFMAFENSISEDYVSEKVLHGYHNYAVPVVYGGANYSRFLPPGSYLNARELDPYSLAVAIRDAIKNPTILESYFKWTNLYTIDSDPLSYHPLCDLCAELNKEIKPAPAMKNFRIWWNGLNGMKWCLSEAYWKEASLVNVDLTHIAEVS